MISQLSKTVSTVFIRPLDHLLGSFISNLIIFVQIMCQICQPWKKGKYHWFLQVCKKWSRGRMKTVDTVLESWDIILFYHINFEIFGYHEVILWTKKVICGFSKNWRFWFVSCACRSSGWYPSGTQDLQINKIWCLSFLTHYRTSSYDF